jgi:hypothetical protein
VERVLVATYGIPASAIVTYAHGETSEFSQRDRTANRVVILSAMPRRMASPVLAEQTPTERQGRRDEPHLVATGADTAAFVARQLGGAAITLSTSQGPVLMTPGTIWGEDKPLVLAAPMTVYYTIGHNLYESSTSPFLRAYWLDALSAGARRLSIGWSSPRSRSPSSKASSCPGTFFWTSAPPSSGSSASPTAR